MKCFAVKLHNYSNIESCYSCLTISNGASGNTKHPLSSDPQTLPDTYTWQYSATHTFGQQWGLERVLID